MLSEPCGRDLALDNGSGTFDTPECQFHSFISYCPHCRSIQAFPFKPFPIVCLFCLHEFLLLAILIIDLLSGLDGSFCPLIPPSDLYHILSTFPRRRRIPTYFHLIANFKPSH